MTQTTTTRVRKIGRKNRQAELRRRWETIPRRNQRIRQMYRNGWMTQKQLAEMFNLTQARISQIVRGSRT